MPFRLAKGGRTDKSCLTFNNLSYLSKWWKIRPDLYSSLEYFIPLQQIVNSAQAHQKEKSVSRNYKSTDIDDWAAAGPPPAALRNFPTSSVSSHLSSDSDVWECAQLEMTKHNNFLLEVSYAQLIHAM